MAQKGRASRPSGNRPAAGEPRRLGTQTSAPQQSAGAARRAARSRGRKSLPLGWISVGVVILIVVVFVVVHATSSSKTPTTSDSAGRNPAAAPASLVSTVSNVPASVFDQIGTGGNPAPFLRTTVKTPLLSNGKVQFIYYGAEYCPYCALMRWSLVSALSRFGTFSGLKQTSSADSDGNIPTFSFLNSTYTSKYLTFSPYEAEDRNKATLQNPPTSVQNVVVKYDFPPYTTTTDEGGIPFLSIGNMFVTGGDPTSLANLFTNGTLVDGGPGRDAIADGIRNPTSANGKIVGGSDFIAEANFLSATICVANGGKPASVCTSSGVKAAEKALSALKPTK